MSRNRRVKLSYSHTTEYQMVVKNEQATVLMWINLRNKVLDDVGWNPQKTDCDWGTCFGDLRRNDTMSRARSRFGKGEVELWCGRNRVLSQHCGDLWLGWPFRTVPAETQGLDFCTPTSSRLGITFTGSSFLMTLWILGSTDHPHNPSGAGNPWLTLWHWHSLE